jgi:hypothetical protein
MRIGTQNLSRKAPQPRQQATLENRTNRSLCPSRAAQLNLVYPLMFQLKNHKNQGGSHTHCTSQKKPRNFSDFFRVGSSGSTGKNWVARVGFWWFFRVCSDTHV